ncbi:MULTISPECIES: polyprenyl synthetase family protein [unclassified Streptomyces]|uniref:polyprenyl synthetase family protein n=1 Tax=unclassified Streptomyces TaxID=2593676 RepID=UPI002DDB0B74|nr:MULTISPECIES: polyprenyl synthetase family protein [unclassified Streptomyces]WSA91232.1 polyprenyl synthetase family protein [Streptomyces sp. NBC_01795]WSB75556.1 polyprenyl synthetase family protein [Streptomyces sp. NBC_01775]WSS16159.1 polyprenyl synthetase family protein [Streptomyces sp. NBC_01186]WSS44978.1 polyprenyl synthetase family protein [Streptomyces sp. NBC_01187]
MTSQDLFAASATATAPLSVPVAPSLLHHANERTEPVLREVVGTLQPELRRVCGYHFGWTQPDGSPTHGVTPGVCLRAALALHAASAGTRAAAGTAEAEEAVAAALPGAAAVELIYNWSALHDDVMDGDALRRGRAAVWAVYGTGWAILAGDALLGAAHRLLLAMDEHGTAALRLAARTTSRLVGGRSAELALRRRAPAGVSVEEYAAVAAARSSALLECALAGGALLGGADERMVTALTRAGHHLGIAWRASRDIEDLWSGTSLTGKPVMSGLREGGPSLPLIAALHAGNPAARTLAESLGGGPACPPPPDELVALIEHAGGRAAAHEISAWQLTEALARLDEAGLPPATHTTLRTLFRYTLSHG